MVGAAALLLAVAAAAVVVLGGFSAGAGGSPITVNGALELDDAETAMSGCVGQGGYRDIRSGTQVTVTDEAGKTVGLGALTAGGITGRSGVCRFYFKVTGVPGDRDFYGVTVSDRGRIQFPRAALDQAVTVTLG